jgi:hypothetical protein
VEWKVGLVKIRSDARKKDVDEAWVGFGIFGFGSDG